MRTHALLIALAAGVFSTASLAQSTAGPSAPPGKGKPDSQAVSKADYGVEDCRKDMANAEDAKRAGHITDKEHAEQKKMAQTKMRRDAGRGESDGGKAAC
ncbi:hypothetical protein [Noviherbaspirillum aridicola]|uniref:Uncharacterized protein n=1 Tax=Noviherbaspirillum aridicola TaxID=2849687 RepID=A0ABQ4PZY4_9BURK|nr:hypothetical protein [Noviherbaspirillum aridicola]GIZ50457.1 hypothetical protein NCCP691_04710 [Noviherbaspirillum aridicola]